MRNWLKWQTGRQNGGYRKMLLFEVGSVVTKRRGLLGADIWILDYPPHSSIPVHTDPIPTARHYRVNLVWRTGGAYFHGDTTVKLGERFILFRPDMSPHSVGLCRRRRVVLSLGFAVR